MILATIIYDDDAIVGIKINKHGRKEVCAAVSILTLNTINSIEHFTGVDFTCEVEEKSGYLDFMLTDRKTATEFDVALLLNSLRLGLEGISQEYPKHLELRIKSLEA